VNGAERRPYARTHTLAPACTHNPTGPPASLSAGLQVRYDRHVGPEGRLKFMTDGILLRELQVRVCVCMRSCVYD